MAIVADGDDSTSLDFSTSKLVSAPMFSAMVIALDSSSGYQVDATLSKSALAAPGSLGTKDASNQNHRTPKVTCGDHPQTDRNEWPHFLVRFSVPEARSPLGSISFTISHELKRMRRQSEAIVSAFFEENPDIRYVQYVFHDYGNIPRCITSTKARTIHIASQADSGNIGSVSHIGYCSWGISRHEDVWEKVMQGSDHWIPQWETLRRSTRKDTAIVLCSTKQVKEAPQHWFDRDPRTVLARTVARARQEHDMDFKVGYEIEFHLLPGASDLTVPNAKPGPSGAYNLAATHEPAWNVVLDMVDTLEQAGIQVWNFHPELDSDEFEISLAPSEPMRAVDDLLHSLNIIRAIAGKHGMRATMHPQRYPDAPTIGMHAHVSLSKCDVSDHFLAGLLQHLRGISGILMGGYDSFGAREVMLGHGDISWSTAKNTPIRRFGKERFEIRPPDCLGNPYLQLAAILGSGLLGVNKSSPLTWKENTWRCETGMDQATRDELGVTQRLPTTLREAIEAMEADGELRSVLGEKCYETILGHRRGELVRAERWSRAERTRCLVEYI